MRATTIHLWMALSISAAAQTTERPVRAVTDPGVVTTRQAVTPAGIPAIFQGKIYGVAFGESSAKLWVLNATQLYEMDWRENKVLTNITHKSLPGLLGVAFDGKPYVSALNPQKKAALFAVAGTELKSSAEFAGKNAGGVAVRAGIAVVPLTSENKAAIVELSTGKIRGLIATGIAPFAAVINASGTVAYVSNWGGRKPGMKDKTAPTGLAKDADQVVVDDHGIASSGTITRIDLNNAKSTHTIATGLHPNGLAWDEKSARLYAANNNNNTVTVIDTRSQAVIRQISIQPFAQEVIGIAPTAVAVSQDGLKLYVACGGINAVAVIDTRSFAIQGFIPTGWYANSLALSPDGKYLAIGALLGAGSSWRDEPRMRFVHSYRGSVNVVEIPSPGQLASYTAAVAENNRLPLKGASVPRNTAATKPTAVPERAGDASLIQHVVYIVKENRTYDQVFGDMEKGNGDASLVMFGEDTTPNQHKLAREFVLLDNFYASGGNSANGHQWVTQANEAAYTMWPGYQGRSYPYDGTDPLGITQGGTIWDSARGKGKSVRIYGEYSGRMGGGGVRRPEYLKRWKVGDDFTNTFNITAPAAHMNAFIAHNFPAYSTTIPDVIRAQIFLKDLSQWERSGVMPNLVVVQLPSDHTSGTTPGASTPKAMVADNDLAVGLIVEALSKSKFWSKMAIFIVEDDAQNGVDHVDGHRTVALAVSPYIRRGHVDSTFYSNQSMLKTIELMLGLPALSLFDLIANDMRASFTDEPNLTPFTHSAPVEDLFAVNPPLKALKGPAKEAAQASAKMRWDVPDAVPSARLNRILWHTVRGWDTAYPGARRSVFAPYSLDSDEDERR